jgi:hypothetical protein
METLATKYPKVEDFLAAPPATTGAVLLDIAYEMQQSGMVYPDAVNAVGIGWSTLHEATDANPLFTTSDVRPEDRPWPWEYNPQVATQLALAWSALVSGNQVHPAVGENGRIGWMVLDPKVTAAKAKAPVQQQAQHTPNQQQAQHASKA